FDQAQPNPPDIRPDVNGDRRWFRADRGGWSGLGRGTGDGDGHNIEFDVGGVDFDSDILPDAEFGYYDGWVEHDDLASSKYHRMGDKRLGEVMSPAHDRVTVPGTDDGEGQDAEYDAIFGVDLGRNNPNVIPTKDGFCVAAGPGAVAVHGDSGYDAGDIMILEWLTWRRDGQSSTVAPAWESENGSYHPYATPSATQFYFPSGRCTDSVPNDGKDGTRVACLGNEDCPPGESCNRPGTAIGFRDYNLDGMIDQGEVRPALSANSSVDVDPATPDNDGTHTNYPFNRRRMLEDIVESLDIGLDFNNFVDADNLVSGIVLVPPQAYTDINRFPNAPSYYPIFTMDTGSTKPFFHDLVICQDCRDFPSAIAYAAHEYLHTWEFYPDLYDYGVFDDAPPEINCPIGRWDIMSRFGGLVHPNPALKERSGWIKTVDLKSVLTPGVETTLTLPPAELVRDGSYYFLENSERTGERFYFWSAGSGFDSRQPGPGMVILRTTNASANQEALAQQQRTDPYNFLIVQADGNGDLEACEAGGNTGDAGDVWPGSTGATQFNFTTTPSSSWPTETRWTGLNITDIQPDVGGSVVLSLSWVPTNIPSLQFIDPPGGESVASIYQVRYDVTDVFGGTQISLYYTNNGDVLPDPSNATFINGRSKIIPGTTRQSLDWNIGGVPDGRYFIFAKLVPGSTPDGTERKFTQPNASRNNKGNGTLAVLNVDVSSSSTSKARSETWIVECVDPDGLDWRVNSSISQPRPDDPDDDAFGHATTGVVFESDGGEVRFRIQAGPEPFQLGDTFNFTTTGITQYSQSVTIIDSRIRTTPVAVIDPLSALSGEPPLTVTLDARSSSDPEGLPLTFAWDFGDGTNGSGPQVIHTFVQAGTFTVVLRATNPNGQFGTTQVDVNVLNNSPTAKISADPTNGPAPLTVQFDSAGSSDLETAIGDLIYQWDFGDGLTANSQGEPGVFQIPPPHFYSRRADGTICTSDDPCLFNALLTVTDTGGKSSTDTIAILVGNSSPIPNVTVSRTSGTSPLTVIFNAILSNDPDGDDIEIIWEFEEGTFTPTTGRYSISGPPGVTNGEVIHVYTQAGTYQPKAILSDGRGLETMWTGPSINVTEPQEGSSDPIADFELVPEPPYEIGQEFTVKSNSRDRPNPATTLTHVWNFGDGSPERSGLEREGTHAYTTAP
ncbi:MAG: PKD domain-containing protein, partial [Planctomycetes bacterium]|nr:PKD domain-containing protein [Planctomycetota bacterium]